MSTTITLPTPADRWWEQARCHGMDTEQFFPLPSGAGAAGRQVRRICQSCPVRRDCLLDELARTDPHTCTGVWGGTSADQRRALLRCLRGICAHEPGDCLTVDRVLAAMPPPAAPAGPPRQPASTAPEAIIERVREMAAAGALDREIAHQIGWAPESVGRLRRRHGIRRGIQVRSEQLADDIAAGVCPKPDGRSRLPVSPAVLDLIRTMASQGHSDRQIAARTGHRRGSSVAKLRQRHGIPPGCGSGRRPTQEDPHVT